jgi:hypothetical protein
MTILEMIVELLKLHGIEGSGFDRIDVALAALYEAEMGEKKVEKKKPEKKTAVDEEHVGI